MILTTIPALTVWQPWATLIAMGAKPFEFRGWAAPKAYQGQRIAIHAGARRPSVSEMRDLLLECQSSFWRGTGLAREPAIELLTTAIRDPSILHRSAIVCTAILGRPIRNEELTAAMGLPAPIVDSDRDAHTNWGWPLTDIEVMTPPIPATGKQGIWRWAPPCHADVLLEIANA